MNLLFKITLYTVVILLSVQLQAQHHSKMVVELNSNNKTISTQQEITFFNQSNDTLTSIVLNDWNNAYSNKNTPLAKRFSDEFYRGFHLAKEEERGSTTNISVLNANKMDLSWERTEKNPDLIEIKGWPPPG